MSKTIKLGQKVKDKLTGLKGIATAKYYMLNGTIQYCVKPKKKGKDTKIPDGTYIDHQRLIVIDESTEYDQAVDEHEKYLGKEVKDLVTGLKGTVTSYHMHLNGCADCSIQTKSKGNNKAYSEAVFTNRLKVTGQGKVPMVVEDTGPADMPESKMSVAS